MWGRADASPPADTASRRSTPQQFQRETNIALVLRSLRDKGPASRSELATRIGIDRSTMTSIAAELSELGLVSERDGTPAGARGGRPPRLLEIDDHRVVSVGAELTERELEWVACSLDGNVLVRSSIPRPHDGDARSWASFALEQLSARMRAWRDEHRPGSVIAGVGLGAPGVVEPAMSVLRESVVLGARDIQLGRLWEWIAAGRSGGPSRRGAPAESAVPLLVDNDANCCAWNVAEDEPDLTTILVQLSLHRRPGGGLRDSLAGVGLSFVFGGRVHYGSSHAAGELRGYRWREGDSDQLGLASELTRTGADADELDLLEPIVAELLQNLGVIASALDPGRVVLAGDLAGREELVDRQLGGALAASPLVPLRRRGILTVARPDQYPVAVGAARMVLSDLFSLPSVEIAPGGTISWQMIGEQLRVRMYKGVPAP
ncbi:MAG: ROK family transcriptional regulator [Spirochaetota bacterium]